FFFSSRRRHTSFSRDWSSDVCSSDLLRGGEHDLDEKRRSDHEQGRADVDPEYGEMLDSDLERDQRDQPGEDQSYPPFCPTKQARSEARRVGIECASTCPDSRHGTRQV